MFRRLILSALLIAALAPARHAVANWSTYQHDARHTSKAEAAGPSNVGIKWTYQHPNSDNSIPGWTTGTAFTAGIAVGPDGTIYAAGEDGRGYAFNTNGSVKYIYEGIGVCCAPPVVDLDGTIYFSGNGLYALNPDFTLKWFYPDGGNCCGAITVGPDGTIYVGNGWLHALDPNPAAFIDPETKTVAARWVAPYGNWSAAVNADNTTIYVQDMASLYAVRAVDDAYGAAGSLKWSQPIVNDLETSPVIGDNEIVYIADDQKLIAIDPSLIAPEDTTPPPAAVRTVWEIPGKQVGMMAYDSATFYPDDTIVATVYGFSADPESGAKIWNADGEVSSVNVTTSTATWTQPIWGSYGSPYAPSPIIDSRGAVYVGSNDYDQSIGVDYMTHLYAFDADGQLMFQYDTPLTYHSDIRVPVISDSGDLYVLMDGAIKNFTQVSDVSVAVTAYPTAVNANGTLTYTTTVSNTGPDTAKTTTLRQILPSALSNTAVDSPSCSIAGRTVTCNFEDMPSEAMVVVTITGTAPGYSTNLSTYAQVMTGSVDLNTTDNSVTLVTTVQTRDLVITAVTDPPTTARRGTGFSVTFTEKNQGNAATQGSNVARFYLSSDGTTKTKLLTGTRTVPILSANATATYTNTVTIPSTTTAAAYWLLACADDTNLVSESNATGTGETNNCRASATTIDVTY